MTVQTITSTFSSGGTPPVNVSWMNNPTNISATLFMGSTSATFTGGIQYTVDDSFNTGLNSSTWNWIDSTVISTTTFAGSSQGATANINFPVTYVRANVTVAPSSLSVKFTVLQGLGG
jgi:hypothetical protein